MQSLKESLKEQKLKLTGEERNKVLEINSQERSTV